MIFRFQIPDILFRRLIIAVKSGLQQEGIIVNKYYTLLIPLILMVAILGMSSFTGKQSGTLSESIAGKIVTLMEMSGPKYFTVKEVNDIIRKLTHFTEYLLFTVVVFRATETTSGKPWLSVIISFVVCFLLATTDERYQLMLHQMRYFSVFDIMIDCTGGMVGILAVGISRFKL